MRGLDLDFDGHFHRLEGDKWLELTCLQNVLENSKSFLDKVKQLIKLPRPLGESLRLPIERHLDPPALVVLRMVSLLAPVILRQHANPIKVLVKPSTNQGFGLSREKMLILSFVIIRFRAANIALI